MAGRQSGNFALKRHATANAGIGAEMFPPDVVFYIKITIIAALWFMAAQTAGKVAWALWCCS
jgi:hypothetical protein